MEQATDEEAATMVRVGPISEALKSIRRKQPEAKKEVLVQKAVSYEQASTDDVKQVLTSYSEQLQKMQKRGLSSYFVDPIFQVTGNEIELVIGSKTLQQEIQNTEASLITFFNEMGYNPSIRYTINAEKVNAYKLFTPKQQFEALAKKHPILKEFEERFGLDFDV